MCPIFKAGEKITFSNYRPISILPSFSKVYEKAISNRLLSFFESKNILKDNQYGFRSKRSTYMAILDMYNKISLAIDSGKFSVGIFLDLSKAFDTLNHNILLKKLEHYGIRGTLLNWFKSYLQDRQQFVYLNGACSSSKPIYFGVPQGSILGPLLFIIYINDVTHSSKILNFILFADDTNLFHCDDSITNLILVLNRELQHISDWFKANKLSLNASKSNFIVFGNKRVPNNIALDINIDGFALERSTHIKFLGVFFLTKNMESTYKSYIW